MDQKQLGQPYRALLVSDGAVRTTQGSRSVLVLSGDERAESRARRAYPGAPGLAADRLVARKRQCRAARARGSIRGDGHELLRDGFDLLGRNGRPLFGVADQQRKIAEAIDSPGQAVG